MMAVYGELTTTFEDETIHFCEHELCPFFETPSPNTCECHKTKEEMAEREIPSKFTDGVARHMVMNTTNGCRTHGCQTKVYRETIDGLQDKLDGVKADHKRLALEAGNLETENTELERMNNELALESENLETENTELEHDIVKLTEQNQKLIMARDAKASKSYAAKYNLESEVTQLKNKLEAISKLARGYER
jgi:predicted RNase H-like nuclease (RuvC/YqgF family)